MNKRKRRKTKIRHCVNCGAVLKEGYWRRCKSCWNELYTKDHEFDSNIDDEFPILIDIDDF